MKIKMMIIFCFLVMGVSAVMGLENGAGIFNYDYNTWMYNDIAIRVVTKSGCKGLADKYKVVINTINTKINNHPQTFSESLKLITKTIDKTVWTITADQLPLNEHDCIVLNIDTCDNDTKYCYKHCLSNMDPYVVAFDNKNKKVYLNYASVFIGTGGGPGILFVADINKKTIKLLKSIAFEEKGIISPSSHYMVLYGTSVMSVYDTQKNTWFDINKSENDYSGERHRYILHSLDFKNWISDTQFTFIDSSRYFTSLTEKQPFVAAKEVIYDIKNKKKEDIKTIGKEEYDKFICGNSSSNPIKSIL